MSERWRQIPGFENYEVSDRGSVRNAERGKLRRTTLVGGYRTLLLYRGGRGFFRAVHRLVLEAFSGPCPDGMEACHGDGDRENNALSNLRWGTPQSNTDDKARHGTLLRGRDHPSTFLTEIDVERTLDLRRFGLTQRQIGDWLGISNQHVSNILRQEHWAFAEA